MERCPHFEALSSLARTRLGAGAAVEPPSPGDAAGGDGRGAPGGRFALFDLGFRPFYLGAALFAALGVPAWIAHHFAWSGFAALPGMAWHAHEMVFGFAAAVIVGFLFTAARAWTGLATPSGAPLAALVALWAAGRVLMITGPDALAAAVDVLFLPLAAAALWSPLRRSRNRNQFFVAILLLLAAVNVAFHLSRLGVIGGSPILHARAALFVVVFVVALMAGRVVPSFTRNVLPDAGVRQRARLDQASLALLATAFAAHLWSGAPALVAALALAAAALHAARALGWAPWATRRRPILWILHAAYAWIPLGLALLAAAALGLVPQPIALHALAIGAVGGMILGMITRTARGHTGRPLVAGPAETLAYALVLLAALARIVPALRPELVDLSLVASAALWSGAFAIYLVEYVPILCLPRADGKPI